MAAVARVPTGADEPWAAFRAALLDDGVLLATGVDGVYGRSAVYESVADAIDRLVLAGRRRPGRRERAVPAGHAVVELRAERATSSRSPTRWARSTRSGATTGLHAELLHAAEAGEDWASGARAHRHGAVPGRLPPALPDLYGRPLPEGGRRFEVYG